jgi:hypothetical protein
MNESRPTIKTANRVDTPYNIIKEIIRATSEGDVYHTNGGYWVVNNNGVMMTLYIDPEFRAEIGSNFQQGGRLPANGDSAAMLAHFFLTTFPEVMEQGLAEAGF